MYHVDSLLGRKLAGNFRLDEVIAVGPVATVYRGTNLRVDQTVGLKVIAASLADDDSLVERFRADIRQQALLLHPNIVPVYDFIVDGPIQAIVMEYIDGWGLDEVLFELDQPMPLGRIRNLIEPVFEAVGYAHQKSMLHLDIKPSNILISSVSGREFPKIMDFGIAKALASAVAQPGPTTMTGTLLYMSPEQCKALKTVDHRSDIYSLGITLYQMATGMVPFYAESAFDIMLAHIQSPPTPLRELAASISEPFEQLVLKAIEKQPADRFQSIDEMMTAFASLSVTEQLGVAASEAIRKASDATAVQLDARKDAVNHRPPIAETGTRERMGRLPPAAKYSSVAAAAESPQSSAKRMRLIVPHTSDWLTFFDPNVGGGGVFCPTTEPPEVGTPIRLEISFVGGPRIFVHCVVTWRRTQLNDARTRAGVGLQVHPKDRNKIAYIAAWAEGEVTDQRQQRRLPLRLKTIYSARAGRRVNFTRDIHINGVFLRSQELLEPDTLISLTIIPPDAIKPVELKGRVARLVESPDERGMGIELQWSEEAAKLAYEQLIHDLEKRLLAGSLPDEVVG